jgi:hypothetical protein
MSWLSRFVNVFRSDRVSEEIDEELGSHIEEGSSKAAMRAKSAAHSARRCGSAKQPAMSGYGHGWAHCAPT